MGWERGWREVQEGRAIVYLWLIHVDVWQKPTQYCKAIILQLKVNEIQIKKNKKIKKKKVNKINDLPKKLMAFLFTSN